MCGIAGIYAHATSAPSVDEAELLRIRERMVSRGPDAAGLWMSHDRRLGLAHRRLAIIDLSSGGAQPMVRQSGDLVITFNGEIYNYKALREQLVDLGYRFQSYSDTEVILHLYAHYGADMLIKLRGMFAFAIWDTRREEFFLARDTYGIKPLYYADASGSFRFASSVKALLEGGAISREPDFGGQAGFYLFGSVPEPFTTYSAIKALPAGSWMKVDARGAHEAAQFQSIAEIYADAERNAESLPAAELEERARAAFLDSVRHHIVADVPVGAFLSGGVDSAALVGLMRDAGAHEIQTLTLSFAEFEGRADDEAPLAAEVARLYATKHTTRVVAADEFGSDLPKILEAMDQPTIDGVNTWFVAKAVSELGLKVALSGLGGDELLGGYPSFADVPRWKRQMRLPSRVPGLGVGLRCLVSTFLGGSTVSPKAFSIIEYGGHSSGAYLLRRGLYLPWELEKLMGKDAAKIGLARLKPLAHIGSQLGPMENNDFALVSIMESSLYMRNQLLRDTDWASMAYGLEVRVPLVDVPLLKAVAPLMLRLGSNFGKGMLAGTPSIAVPEQVAKRSKTGFGIPLGEWTDLSVSGKSRPVYGHSRRWAQTLGKRVFSQADYQRS